MILCLNCQPSVELLKQLYTFTPRLEPFDRGVYLEVNRNDADLIAQAYDPTAGLAETKEEARLLALAPGEIWVKMDKPVSGLSLDVLEQFGLNPTTLERLTWLGVTTLGDLMSWSKAQLQRYLGDEAKLILSYLKGPFTEALSFYTPKAYLSKRYTFEDAVLEPFQLAPVLEHLCQSLEVELGDRAASRLELTAFSRGLAFNAARVAKHPITNVNLLTLTYQALEDSGVLGLEVDKLALTLKGLYRPSEQEELWQQKKRWTEAVAKVEKRFPGAMLQVRETDPYSLLPEFRYALVPVEGEVTCAAQNPDRNYPQRSTQDDRRPTRLVGA